MADALWIATVVSLQANGMWLVRLNSPDVTGEQLLDRLNGPVTAIIAQDITDEQRRQAELQAQAEMTDATVEVEGEPAIVAVCPSCKNKLDYQGYYCSSPMCWMQKDTPRDR